MTRPEDAPRRRVLVVEDEALIALDLEQWLTELGFEVIGPFGRAHDALRALDGPRVDFAVLDYVLRDGTSGSVADRLGSHQVPYVYVSGMREPIPGGDSAAMPVLEKPISQRDMTRALRDVFDPEAQAG